MKRRIFWNAQTWSSLASFFSFLMFTSLPLHAWVVNHEHATLADLQSIPEAWVQQAKADLVIAYGHTSHGSQLVTGMDGLESFLGEPFIFNSSGDGGALELRDTPFSGASDLGSPDRSSWERATRSYLNTHEAVNVIIWSWCGQVSSASEEDINTYLSLMSGLEADYPNVVFVYMTGHLDGSGLEGNLHQRNEQIRQYCEDHGKILYDFADIESYNPDGDYFGDKRVDDACNYDSDGDGHHDSNWAQEWQSAHTEGVDWYRCSAAHSEAVNGNMKAYAAWYLWARLAGWDGGTGAADITAPTIPTGLQRSGENAAMVELEWNASQDAVGVVQYRIYRDGNAEVYGTSQDNTFYDSGAVLGGHYTYRVSAVDAAGNESTMSAALELWVHDEQAPSFEEWCAGSFSEAELADPSISGPDADPDGIGLSNLCRYAFDLASRGPVCLPVVMTMENKEGSEVCCLEMQRKGFAPELAYVVEASTDLHRWTVVQTLEPGYPKSVFVEDSELLNSGTRRFMRVRVVQAD